MQTRKLGNSDLQITRVGYGAWAIGGSGWQFAWGSQDDNESITAFTVRSNSASTGSTLPPSTAWDTPKKWLAVL